ncbi:hypothetical protein [uncultured Gammaproteobacteria bacterium]|nr:hypothetical protein [uncultured Gammaproteobacteria bacterium]
MMSYHRENPCNSPPHRWFRKSCATPGCHSGHSPPHRWLRKVLFDWFLICHYSPPHRWLRKG